MLDFDLDANGNIFVIDDRAGMGIGKYEMQRYEASDFISGCPTNIIFEELGSSSDPKAPITKVLLVSDEGDSGIYLTFPELGCTDTKCVLVGNSGFYEFIRPEAGGFYGDGTNIGYNAINFGDTTGLTPFLWPRIVAP